MLFDDSYRTLESTSEGYFKDRGSKFFAFAYPIRSEADTRPLLAQLRELHPKAVHHCYAYRLGLDRTHYRANDDGEPSGSAGRPILNTLYSRDLTNVLVVVVRYFGGTLLGVPGLIHAYKTATEQALDQATVVVKYLYDRYELSFTYAHMNDAMRLVKDMELPVLEQQFELNCRMQVEVRKTLVERFAEACEKIVGLECTYLPS
ncbi:IMPACT family protein [Rhabdobacter roseus]|uniref:Putative YigZ family protein n=1 Tax=Rhabdobacter roseus TaxID=1655419 RepID=A0A840TZ25_9BACT|nr:putative YigZ family protein [Rhabdobacter roseus]